MLFMKKLIVMMTLAIAISPAMQAQRSPVFVQSGKAIRGYDPVAYFTDGKPVAGKEELNYQWNNATWYFADQQHLDSFRVNPEKYIPQYGGFYSPRNH